MRARGLEPTPFAYESALHACRRKGGWREAVGVLQAARAAGVSPSPAHVSHVLRVVADSAKRQAIGPPWVVTMGLLDEVRQQQAPSFP